MYHNLVLSQATAPQFGFKMPAHNDIISEEVTSPEIKAPSPSIPQNVNAHSITLNGDSSTLNVEDKKTNSEIKKSTHKKGDDHGNESDQIANIAESYKAILTSIGESPEREGLLKTPERAAKALLYFTKGYNQTLKGKHRMYKQNITHELTGDSRRSHWPAAASAKNTE